MMKLLCAAAILLIDDEIEEVKKRKKCVDLLVILRANKFNRWDNLRQFRVHVSLLFYHKMTDSSFQHLHQFFFILTSLNQL